MNWEAFEALCKEKSITPSQAGEMVGVSAAAVSKWRKGTVPTGEKLCLLADYFGVSVDYLLGRSKIKKPIDIDELELTEGDLFIINQLRDLSREERTSAERDIFAIILSKK